MRLAKLKRWLVAQRHAAAPVPSVPGAEACVLGPGASLLPEAEINNFSGPPEIMISSCLPNFTFAGGC